MNSIQHLTAAAKQEQASAASPYLNRAKLKPVTPLLTTRFEHKTPNARSSSIARKEIQIEPVQPVLQPQQIQTQLIKVEAKTPILKHSKLPKITNRLNNLVVNENESAQFVIKLNGKDRPPFKWYQDENELKLNDDFEITEKEDEITLTIKSCKNEHSGIYYIKFKNSFGEVFSNKAKLVINRAPKFIKYPKSTYINSEHSVKFESTIDALPKPKIVWILKGKELVVKDNVKFENDLRLGNYNLAIPKVNLNTHLGTYTLRASNSVGTVEYSFDLDLLELPKISNLNEETIATEGEPVKFMIQITGGKPKPNIKWFYNDDEINLEENNQVYDYLELENTHIFVIKAASLNNSGNYYAKVSNEAGCVVTNKAKLEIKLPATFVKPLVETIYGNLSKNKELPVQIISKPLARIKVFKDNREIKSSSHLKFESEKLNENLIGFKLIIENTQASDSGIYRIEASNKFATVSTQTHFIVKGEPVFVRKPSDLTVIEKKPVNIYCEVLGSPVPKVEWFKDDKLIEKSDNIQIESKAKGLNSLLIKSVTIENVGAYKVKARNDGGQIECLFNLSVDVAPYIITPLKEKIEVLSGEQVRLECQIAGSPKPNIIWEKKGEEIKTSKENGIELINEGNKYVLVLKSTLIEDSGIFSIVALNRLGKIQSKAEIVVKCAPYFKRKAEDVLVVEKRTSKLEVEIHSVPKAQVIWYKNNKEIQANDRIQLNDAKGGVHQLIIKNSNKDDTGTYKCKAFNEIGQIECQAELAIERPPEFVRKLDKLITAEQCEAEWIFQLIGLPKPILEISRNDQILDIASLPELYSIEELDNKLYCLKFNCVSKKDVGTWRITATNSAGKATTINKLESMSLITPKFLKCLNTTRLPEDVDNKIEILISALPFPDIVWYKNNRKINFDLYSRKYKMESDKENSSIKLVILNSQEDDSGLYKVSLFNPGGEASSEAMFTFKGHLPKFVHKPQSIKVLTGKKALFACCLDGDPMPIVTWSKNGFNLIESSKIDIYYDDSNDAYYLEITDCNSKDNGTYKATASNQFGSESVSFTLLVTQNKSDVSQVEDLRAKLKNRPRRRNLPDESTPEWHALKPVKLKKENKTNNKIDDEELKLVNRFLKDVENEVSVSEHKTAVFTCSVSDLNAQVKWFLNDNELTNDKMNQRFEMLVLGDLRMLKLNDCLKTESNSVIKCKWNDLETFGKLFITDCVISIKNLKNQKVLNNSNVLIDCETIVDLTIPVEFKWKRNGELIDMGKNKYEYVHDKNIHQLKIHGFNDNDSGEYEIYVAEPKDFTISSRARIEVDYSIVPKRPTIKYDSRLNRDIILTSQQNLNITCEISGVPKPFIKWFKDYTEIYPINKTKVNRAKIDNNELYTRIFIEKIRLEESGDYSCRVENEIGKCDAKFTVKVLDVPHPPDRFKIDNVSTTSSRLSWLTPNSDGNSPILGYYLEKYDSKRDTYQRLGKTSLNEFFVEKLEKGQRHHFRIYAENKVGLSKPCELIKDIPDDTVKEIEIGEKPKIIEPLSNLRVHLGDIAIFHARVFSKQPIEIKWYLNDRYLNPFDLTQSIKNNQIEMIINPVELNHQGTYSLVIKNQFGQATTQSSLVVLQKPEIKYVSKYDKELILFAQQNLNICCEISGNPKPDLKWFKDNFEIMNRECIQTCEGVSTLFIEKVTCKQAGEYMLRAENDVGMTDIKIQVKIVDVPLAPENFSAEDVSSTTCKLTWQTPKNDGNSPILGYFIERYDSRRGSFVKLGNTSLNEFFVDKLEKGHTHKFRVYAENKVGLSEPCELKEYVVGEGKLDLPSAPDPPQINDITATSCRVTWTEPCNTGGSPIKGYYIERKFASRWLRLNYNFPEMRRYMQVNDLMEGKDYEFRICAVNERGEGAFSRPSVPFTAKNQYEKPSPPTHVQVKPTGKTSCKIIWLPPDNTGGLSIYQYLIEMRRKGEPKFSEFTSDFINECEYELYGLNESREYQFRVIADNKFDKSAPSEPSKYYKPCNHELPEITIMPEYGNMIGANCRIEANVYGTPSPDITWRKGIRILSNNSFKYSISYSGTLAVLIIKNVCQEDDDEYTIEAENLEGTVSESFKFKIYGPPSIEIESKYKLIEASAGYKIRLPCRITGTPRPEIFWYKNGSLLVQNSKIKFGCSTDIDQYMEISDCNKFNTGIYQIRVKNDYGERQDKFEVFVKDVPDKPKGPLDAKLEPNSKSAMLQWEKPILDGGSDLICYIIEYARVEKLNNQKCQNNLLLDDLNWINAGSVRSTKFQVDRLIRNQYYYFRVLAENLNGISEPLECSHPIHTKPTSIYPPSAPMGPLEIKNIKSSECTLSWGLPEDDGNDDIQSFTVEIREDLKPKWTQVNTVDVSKTQLKISRLIEGTYYNFRIAAKNNAGFGAYLYNEEPVMISRPGSVPDPPAHLTISDKQSTNCTLEWKSPAWSGGEELLGYLIEVKIEKSSQWSKVANLKANFKMYKVLNLTENKEYYFRICAVNRIGCSKPYVLKTPVVLKPKIIIPKIEPTPPPPPPVPIQTPKPVPKIEQKTLPSKPAESVKKPAKIQTKLIPLKKPEPQKPLFSVPGRPEGPLVITNITDTTAAYILKTISWRKPSHDGGCPVIGYLIRRKDDKRPWEKRVSANVLTIKIKELIGQSRYVVQVFAENAQGLSTPLESDEPVDACITSLYIVQEIHHEELFFRCTAENPVTTLWANVSSLCAAPTKKRLALSTVKHVANDKPMTNMKLKYIQSKLKLN